MKAIVVMRITVLDKDKLKDYQALAPEIIKSFDGKIVARGGDVVTLEGPDENRRIVILEFPSMELAKEFYYSPAYTEAIEARKGAADFEIIAVEGLATLLSELK